MTGGGVGGMKITVLVTVGFWIVMVVLVISICRAAKCGDEAMDAVSAQALMESPSTDQTLRTLDPSHAATLLGVSFETLLAWEARYGFPTSSNVGWPLQPVGGARPARRDRQRSIDRSGNRQRAPEEQADVRRPAARGRLNTAMADSPHSDLAPTISSRAPASCRRDNAAAKYSRSVSERREKAAGFALDAELVRWFARQWVPDPDRWTDPRVSPLRAEEYVRATRALVVTAEHDPLRDEGEPYARRLSEAGVTTTLRRDRGLVHNPIAVVRVARVDRGPVERVDRLVRVDAEREWSARSAARRRRRRSRRWR